MASDAKENVESLKSNFSLALTTDIKTKMKIARKIVKVCAEKRAPKANKQTIESIKSLSLLKLDVLTQVDPYLRYKAHKNVKEPKTYLEWIEEQLPRENLLTYEEIYDVLHDFYIKNRKIPSDADIVEALIGKVNDSNHVMRQVYKKGFTWLPLPNTKCSIIAEQPQQFHERVRYLEAIQRVRELNREIVYIDQKKFHDMRHMFEECTSAQTIKTVHFLVAASKNGFINNGILRHSSTTATDYPNFLQQFFTNHVQPYISSTAVIVINDIPHQTGKVLNEYSSKTELLDWLKSNDIPHDSEAHRAELYALLEKTKKFVGVIDNFDKLLAGCGFEVLHRPSVKNETSFFLDIWDDMHSRMVHLRPNSLNEAKLVFKSYTGKDWLDFENNLIGREKYIYETDMQMEEIVDKLMMMAKDGQLTRKDLGFDFDCVKPIDDMLSNVIIF